jgi:hypothetical protein
MMTGGGGERRDGAEAPEADAAWRASVIMLALGLIGAGVNLALWWGLAPGLVRTSLWTWTGMFDLCALAILVVLRRRIGTLAMNGLLQTGVAFAYLAGWWTTAQLAGSGRLFEPFTTFRIVGLVVALAAPWRQPPALAMTAASGVLALAQYYSFSASVRATLPFAEPWLSVLVAGTCVILCYYRDRLVRVCRLLAGFEAHMRWRRGEESIDAEELLAQASAEGAGPTVGSTR